MAGKTVKKAAAGKLLIALIPLGGFGLFLVAIGFGFLILAAGTGTAAGMPDDDTAPIPGGSPIVVAGEWGYPVTTAYTVTSRFGWRANAKPHNHRGIDLAQGCGVPIYAAADGVVTFAAETLAWQGWGYRIILDHGGNIQSAYAHLQAGSLTVAEGDRVTKGQVIAREGATGIGTGCHLHYEIYVDGVRIDPAPFMAERGVNF